MNKLNSILFFKNKFLLLLIFWFFLYFSIGSNIYHPIDQILNFKSYKFIDFLSIQFLRSISVLIIFFTLIIFSLKKYINLSNIKKLKVYESYFLLIIIIYSVCSFFGLIASCYYEDTNLKIVSNTCTSSLRNNFLFSLHFIIAMLSSAIICLNIFLEQNKKYIILLTVFTIIFLIFLTSIILTQSEMIYGGFNFQLPFLNKIFYMNSNGAGRTLVITLIFMLSMLFGGFNKNLFLKIFLISFSILLSVFILSFEGRVNIVGMIISITFFTLVVNNENILIKILQFSFLLIIPFLIYFQVLDNHKEKIGNKCLNSFQNRSVVKNEIENLKKNNAEVYKQISENADKFYENKVTYEILYNDILSSYSKSKKDLLVTDVEILLILYSQRSKIVNCIKKSNEILLYNSNRFLISFGINPTIFKDNPNHGFQIYSDVTTRINKYKDKVEDIDYVLLNNLLLKNGIKQLDETDKYFREDMILNSLIKKLDPRKDMSLSISEDRTKTYHMASRGEKWNFIINDIIKRRALIGYGPEYDRLLFVNRLKMIDIGHAKKSKNLATNSDAASGILYSILNSGLIGIVFYVTLFIYILKITYLYLKNYNREKFFLFNFGYVCLGFLIFRSIFEAGVASWNIDYLLMLNCILLIGYFRKELK